MLVKYYNIIPVIMVYYNYLGSISSPTYPKQPGSLCSLLMCPLYLGEFHSLFFQQKPTASGDIVQVRSF